MDNKQQASLPADLLKDIIADLSPEESALLTKVKEKLLGIALEVVAPPAPKKEPKNVTSIADLQAAVDEPFQITLNYQGSDFLITGRRLRPNESAALNEIQSRVIPKFVRGKVPQEDRTLWDDPEYLKAKSDAEITRRALAIYWCFPVVALGKPNLVDPKLIRDYIQGTGQEKGLWNDAILQTLYTTTDDGGVRKAAYTNFT